MADQLSLLLGTAASVGVIHALLGPDHYLPLIALSKVRDWSLRRTTGMTLLCGVGHVLSSILLGALGIALGITVSSLESVEAQRGELATWLLIAVGLVYGAWGLHRATRLPTADPMDGSSDSVGGVTPWALFLVFVLGPCEPLIPVLMMPAAAHNPVAVALVAAVFAVATLGAMVSIVLLGAVGVEHLPMAGLERYSHALAGGVLVLCGAGIRLLGW